MKKQTPLFILFPFIIFLFSIEGFGQVGAPVTEKEEKQPEQLTPEMVKSALLSPMLKESFNQCIEGKEHPEVVKIIVIIGEDGAFTIQGTIPEMDQETMTCFAQVVSMAKVPAPGKKYKMITAITLQPSQPVTITPKEPEKIPPKIQPQAPVLTDEEKEFANSERSSGTAFMISGIVLTLMGAGTLIYPTTFFIAWSLSCDEEDSPCIGFNPVTLGIALAGITGLTVGAFLYYNGVKKRAVASSILKGRKNNTQYAIEEAKKGTMTLTGAIFTVFGGIMTLPSIIYGFYMANEYQEDKDNLWFNYEVLALSVVGLTTTGIGIGLIASAIKKRTTSNQMVINSLSSLPSCMITPAVNEKGGLLSLGCRF